MATAPTITCTIRDTNPDTIALTGDNSVLVRYYSDAYVKMFPVAYGGASINLDTCIIRNDGNTIYGTEGTFNNVTSNTFKCQAEDSNGNYRSHTQTCGFVEYVRLTCNAATLNKPDGNGDMTAVCYGNFFNGNFGKRQNQLTCTYAVVDSNNDVVDSGNMTVSTTDNTYIARAGITGLDYQETYLILFYAKDLLHEVVASQDGVVGKPVFHWGNTDFAFEVPVYFNAGIAGVEGKAIALPECGEWTPVLESANASYTTRKGWYSKVGNVVTIGFYVKAICNPGDTATTILIMGVPYKPSCSASGGGICSGAFMYTNKNFQCYAIDTNGFITTRAQDCGETNGTNLATSSGGCRYPDGKELTVSGTIAYMIYE